MTGGEGRGPYERLSPSGGPVAQSVLDGLGNSQSFVLLPYPWHGQLSLPPNFGLPYRTNVRRLPTVDPDQIATPERTEQLRSLAMLTPGQQSYLNRDDAMMILAALEQLQRWAIGRACCREPGE